VVEVGSGGRRWGFDSAISAGAGSAGLPEEPRNERRFGDAMIHHEAQRPTDRASDDSRSLRNSRDCTRPRPRRFRVSARVPPFQSIDSGR
jgi:hypothetical protein